ncbi:hypothetical protein TNCV_4826591 [Trichonephila clavipes]|nr:hypothetical protein TNCV_4826591 [Trichonephila clavipes]
MCGQSGTTLRGVGVAIELSLSAEAIPASFAIGRLALFLLVERKRDGTALGRSSVNFPVSRMDIINFDREGSVRKQLRLISGREILSLYTPPPAEAGVMWRVRLGKPPCCWGINMSLSLKC